MVRSSKSRQKDSKDSKISCSIHVFLGQQPPLLKKHSQDLWLQQFAVGDFGVSPATWATSGFANVAYRQYFVPDSTGQRVHHAGIGPKVEFHQVRGRHHTSKGEGFFACFRSKNMAGTGSKRILLKHIN